MGKKGGWISAIKRAFSYASKDKTTSSFNGSSEKKRKSKGILSHGESKSFIPLFREPSSIEKILGEVDHHHLLQISPQTPSLPSLSSTSLPRFDRAARIPKESNGVDSSSHASATRIQSAFRGYLARRNFRGLRGLVRLQGVVRSQNVKRQTMNAMKHMQLLVRVQTQIQSRRIQMLENQAFRRDGVQVEPKWTSNPLSGAEQNSDWDDSTLTKEQIEARLRKKVEAVIKRERAMAYAYSYQLWKANPTSAQSPQDIRFPWWWNWLERHQPQPTETGSHRRQSPAIKNATTLTPPKQVSDNKPSFNNHEQSKSTEIHVKAKQLLTPTRTPPPGPVTKHSKTNPTASGSGYEYDLPLRDDDSLTSCPPLSVPNYMNPTASAKAKARANSNPKERLSAGTPGNDSKRRFSFSLTPNIASFRWNKGSSKDAASHKGSEKHRSAHSIGDLSFDSTVSMPAIGGRKPFNRFV